jgi:DNA-binding MarR family transcriptional regulator
MKLTRRQETFIRKLLDLYHQSEGPIHYSALAELVGVSKITAYDMLRHLEEKGYITSHYQLEDEKSGPGRSKVVFSPTPLARKMLAQMAGPLEGADWEKVKEKVITRISPGELPDADLKRELFDRILDEENDKIRYCMEVMMVLIFRMQKSRQRQFFIDMLPSILPPDEPSNRSSLIMIGGFALGLLADEGVQDQVWSQELVDHVKQVQAIIADLDDVDCHHLALSLMDILGSITE